jgi:hypothetical protein
MLRPKKHFYIVLFRLFGLLSTLKCPPSQLLHQICGALGCVWPRQTPRRPSHPLQKTGFSSQRCNFPEQSLSGKLGVSYEPGAAGPRHGFPVAQLVLVGSEREGY